MYILCELRIDSFITRYADGVEIDKLSKTEKDVATFAAEVAPSLTTDIVLYRDENSAAMGYYDHKTDSIHLNVAAKVDLTTAEGQETAMAFTMGHELAHRAKVGSPQEFEAFTQFLIQEYGKAGVDFDTLIGEQIHLSNEHDKTLPEDQRVYMTREMALEEVVAEACSRMLVDTNAGKKLATWGRKSEANAKFVKKLKDMIYQLIIRLRKALKGADPGSLSAEAFTKLDNKVKKILSDMFVDMSTTATERLGTIKSANMLNEINTTGDGGVRYSVMRNVFDVDGYKYENVVKPGLTTYRSVKHNYDDYRSHLERRIFKRTFNLPDFNGNLISVEFAKNGETVEKDGAKHPHPVLGKLNTATDRLKMIAIINIKDLIKNSKPISPKFENSHGWLDHGGWNNRIAYMMDFDVIYPVILHIPKTRDGRYLLYDITVLKKKGSSIDMDATALTAQSARAPETTNKGLRSAVLVLEPSEGILTHPDAEVKKISSTDSDGNQLTAGQQAYFAESEAVDKKGNLLSLYHQTAEDITEFDPRHPGAGRSDYKTPFGIFLKRTDKDIGLKGKKQMRLYANAKNPLRAENREELVRKLRDISHEYAAVCDEIAEMDRTYKKRVDEAGQKLNDYMIEWRQNNPDASRRAIYDDATYNELSDAEDALVDEWVAKDDELSGKAKEIITAALIDAGYDSVFLAKDAGSFGRETDAIIVLYPNQVKSVDNKNPTDNPDIRYRLAAGPDLSARTLLTDPMVEGKNDAQKLNLQRYRDAVAKADGLEAHRKDVQAHYNAMTDEQKKSAEGRKFRGEITKAENRLKLANEAVQRLEQSRPFQTLVRNDNSYIQKRVSTFLWRLCVRVI